MALDDCMADLQRITESPAAGVQMRAYVLLDAKRVAAQCAALLALLQSNAGQDDFDLAGANVDAKAAGLMQRFFDDAGHWACADPRESLVIGQCPVCLGINRHGETCARKR